MLERWGEFVARRAKWVLLTGVALVVAAGVYGGGVFDSLSQGGFDDADSEASRELALERETFGNRGVDAVAIYSSDDQAADSPEFRARSRRRPRRRPRRHDLLGGDVVRHPASRHDQRGRHRDPGADLAGG